MQSKRSNRNPPPYFYVQSQRDPEAQKLVLVGELDLSSVSFLEDALRRAEQEDLETLVLDLERLKFMDCSGLSVFLAAKQRAERMGRRIVFVNAPAQVDKLLKITGQSHLLALPDATNHQRFESRASLSPGTRGDSAAEPDLSTAGFYPTNPGQSEDTSDDLQVIDALLKRVVTLGSETIFRADGASISLARGGQLSTAAASNDMILAMDCIQYELGEGPCFSACTEGDRFESTYLAEEIRWPAFTPRAMSQGISAILSIPLTVQGAPVGALNLCSRTALAFAGEREQATATLLAQQAAIFLRAHANGDISREALDAEAMGLGLEEPLQTDSMSLAKLMLMQNFPGGGQDRVCVDEGPGFGLQSADERKLREMVSQIPWSATQPATPEPSNSQVGKQEGRPDAASPVSL